MKNKKTVWTVALILFVIAGLIIIFFQHREAEPPSMEGGRKHGGPCPGEVKTYVMKDLHMKGILEPGEKFKVIYNYYDCNPVKRNDLVLMQFSTAYAPIIRIARGVAGDKFKLVHDKERQAWDILINGEMIRSEIGRHEPYFFGGEPPPTLSLFLKSRKDGLFSDEIIAFSTYPPGDNDSGVFGLVKYIDILGKVEKLPISTP